MIKGRRERAAVALEPYHCRLAVSKSHTWHDELGRDAGIDPIGGGGLGACTSAGLEEESCETLLVKSVVYPIRPMSDQRREFFDQPYVHL